MQTQPIRLLRIVFSFAVVSVLCWGVARGQQAAQDDKPSAQTDKPSEQSGGVRLIDTTTDVAADNGAASAVRTASGDKSSDSAPQPTSDASLHPVDQAKEALQPPPPAPGTPDNAKTESDKPAGGDKGKGKLEPIPDPQQLGPAELEATSFHGVTPGVTTVEEMEKAWGAPRRSTSKARR